MMETQTVNYQMLLDNVAILPVAPPTHTPGGIYIPEVAKERPQVGTVTSVGPGSHAHGSMTVSPGDTVLYGKYGGTVMDFKGRAVDDKLEVDGTAPLRMPERDILAVLIDGTPHPLSDRVLVEIAPTEEITAGGIYIPNNVMKKPTLGKVLLAGPGNKDDPMDIKVGQTVLYGHWDGTYVDDNGTERMLIRQSAVLCRWPEGLEPGATATVGKEL